MRWWRVWPGCGGCRCATCCRARAVRGPRPRRGSSRCTWFMPAQPAAGNDRLSVRARPGPPCRTPAAQIEMLRDDPLLGAEIARIEAEGWGRSDNGDRGVAACRLKMGCSALCAGCCKGNGRIRTGEMFTLPDGRRAKAEAVLELVQSGAIGGDRETCWANGQTATWLRRARLDADAFRGTASRDGGWRRRCRAQPGREPAGAAGGRHQRARHSSSGIRSRRVSGSASWWSARNCSRV